MFQSSYIQKQKRWGTGQQQFGINDLLLKKDQQIRRLQAELQQQRNRADQAMRMLQSFKNIKQQTQQSSEGLRGEITRRIKAEQQVKKLKKRNEQLESGIKQYISVLQDQLKQKQQSKTNHIVPEEYLSQ